MKKPRVRTGVWVALLLAGAWVLAFALCCRLTSVWLMSGNEANGPTMAGAAVLQALGASRTAVGEQLYANADRVFHQGVGVYRPAAFADWFVRLARAIVPAGHVHLHAEGVNELIPWLYLATRADPHNVEAYVVAAFWLAGEGGRPDLAAGVLDEARANNPKDYRVYLEKGRLALKNGALIEAARALDAAGKLWERDSGTDVEQGRLDRAEMLVRRGLLYEEFGDVPRAILCYREMLALCPGREGIGERLAELEQQGSARMTPAAMRQTIMFQRHHVCAREGH